MNLYRLVTTTLALALLLSACNPNATPVEKVTIAVSRTPLSTPIYIAMKRGYFAQQGLDVEIVDVLGGHRSLQSVLADETQFGTCSDYPVMMHSFSNSSFVVTATFATSTNDVKLMYRTDQGVNQPTDLKGKTVGTIVGTSSHYFLDRFLTLNGMKTEDITIYNSTPENITDDIKSARVSAISAWEPYGYKTHQELEGTLKTFPHLNVYRETFNLVTKRSYTEQHPETLRKLLTALSKAVDYIHAKPKEAQKILKSRLDLDDEFVDWVWQDFDFSLTLDQSLLITLENEANWAIKNGLTSNSQVPNYLHFVHSAALKDTRPGAVTLIQ